MAKISTYPSDSNVTLSDKLIGTDAESNNATKNFTVGDLAGLFNDPTILTGFVPYTGATGDVYLGTYSISAANGIFNNSVELETNTELILDGATGSIGDVMLSQGPGATPIWSGILSNFVPYGGAVGNVDLDIYNLYANLLQANDVQASNGYFQTIYEGNEALTSYAQAFSLVTQICVATNTAKTVEFETGSFSQVATISSNQITFNARGKYMIEVSARVEHISGGGDAQLSFWLKYPTTNVNNSRQVYTVANAHIQELSYIFMVSIANPSDTISVQWTTSNLAARLTPTVAATFYPAAPSAVLNVYKIG